MQPAGYAAYRKPTVCLVRGVADHVGALQAILTARSLRRIGTDAEVVHLREVLPSHLRSDCKTIIGEPRQLEPRLRHLVRTPRDCGRRIDERPVAKQKLAVPRS